MTTLFGIEAKIYRLTTGPRTAWPGTGAHADLAEVSNVRDVTMNITKSEADASTRAGGGWKETVAVMRDASISFEMISDPDDAAYVALRDSFLGNTNSVALAILDRASSIVGAEGLWADFHVTEFSRSESLEGVLTTSVTVKPTRSGLAPEWAEVAA